jgi:hypothetical protein
MSIFVGNLSYEISQEDLVDVFAEYGKVKRVRIPVGSKTHSANAVSPSWKWKVKTRKPPRLRHWMVLTGWADQLKLTKPEREERAPFNGGGGGDRKKRY